MSGLAEFGDNLIDGLLAEVVDPIRRDLLAFGPGTLGARQYRVYRVVREWTGEEVGDGVASFAVDDEIDPPCILVEGEAGKGIAREATPAGHEERGGSELREVSLSYLESEIAPNDLARNCEFYYRVVDGQGQGVAPRYYTVGGKPIPDRESSFGWRVPLVRAQVVEEGP